MHQYLHEIFFLLGNAKRKLPVLIVMFLIVSLMDAMGVGMIGGYLTLIFNPESDFNRRIQEATDLLNIPLEYSNLEHLLAMSLVVIFFFKTLGIIYINYRILDFSYGEQIRWKSALLHTYLTQPYLHFIKRNSSEYINAIQSYVGNFGASVLILLKTVSEGLVGIVLIIFLAFVDMQSLLLLLIILVGPLLVYQKVFKERISNYGEKHHEGNRKMYKAVQEGVGGFKEQRILGKEHLFTNLINQGAKISFSNQMKSEIFSLIPRYSIEFLIVFFLVFKIIYVQITGGDIYILIPVLGIFAATALRLLPLLNTWSNSLIQLRYQRYGVDQLYAEISKAPISLLPPGRRVFCSEEKTETFKLLKLRNLEFKYHSSEKFSLKNINMDIRPGDSIGLIGTSGSGKTTLVDILLGLIKPQKGIIELDGEPLYSSLDIWHAQTAYLPQEVFLMDDTVAQNVAMQAEEKNIDVVKVNEALQQARLKEHVEQLPAGINTIIGERGIRLSGGQRQRVAIARAFYHGREVLVMDEATSSLDNETEREIVEEIKQLKGRKTLIVIAHRLTTVQHCDRIYRLEKGLLVEQGSYDEVVTTKMEIGSQAESEFFANYHNK